MPPPPSPPFPPLLPPPPRFLLHTHAHTHTHTHVAQHAQAGARNPAVGLVLALALLPGDPLAAAPCAASIYAQNILGAWLSTAWWLGLGRADRSGKAA